MNNAMQLKAFIKRIAKEKRISAQLVLQNYMLERLLERVSVSKYHDSFIIKGGFLISAMVGLDSRATMDMDATIRGVPVSEESIRKMLEEIMTIHLDDDINFTFDNLEPIRDDDEYGGYRASLHAEFMPMRVPLKIDITTGDIITPREIEFEYKLMMEERTISVLAYNLSTILAEKLETIISRGNENTRSRDYYDIFVLSKLQKENIDISTVKHALENTARKRGSESLLKDYRRIMSIVLDSEIMYKQWEKYRNSFDYASGINFEDCCDAVNRIMDSMQ